MTMYKVWEGNMKNLEAKATKIRNKCSKYGCDFHFEKVGEEFAEVIDPELKQKVTIKYIIIDCEGFSKINDWEFVSVIEHTPNGNMFRKGISNVELPTRFRECGPFCEHCNKIRDRKDTYIVRNVKTDEYKQVGKSCLKDYTNGLSIEIAAMEASLRGILEEAETYVGGSALRSENSYLPMKEFLEYGIETVTHFGYTKTRNEMGSVNPDSTKSRSIRYFSAEHGMAGNQTVEYSRKEMKSVGFDVTKKEVEDKANAIISWAEELPDTTDYNHNLKVVLGLDYIDYSKVGILVSAIPSYNRAMQKIEEETERKNSSKKSNWVGNIKDRVTVETNKVECVTSFESCYDGYHTSIVYVYKFSDAEGNIYVWKTSTDVPEETTKIVGTIKEHSEYKGTKQTVLTRCKVIC